MLQDDVRHTDRRSVGGRGRPHGEPPGCRARAPRRAREPARWRGRVPVRACGTLRGPLEARASWLVEARSTRGSRRVSAAAAALAAVVIGFVVAAVVAVWAATSAAAVAAAFSASMAVLAPAVSEAAVAAAGGAGSLQQKSCCSGGRGIASTSGGMTRGAAAAVGRPSKVSRDASTALRRRCACTWTQGQDNAAVHC